MYRVVSALLLSLPAIAGADKHGTDECDLSGPKTRWVSSVLFQALADYVPSGEYPLDPCTKDGRIYAENLANLTYWATKMYDASSKGISPGILEGRNYEFGHFEECASASSAYHGIRGKYMMAQLRFEPSPEIYKGFHQQKRVFMVPREESSAWEAVKPTLDARVADRNAVRWALCVPDSCTDRDVQISLQKKVYPALESHKILGNLTVLSNFSYSRADLKSQPSNSLYVFLCLTMMLLALVMASSIYDYNLPKGEEVEKPWFLDFSVKRNMEDLFRVTKNEFSVISGLKVISMCLIIYGHRMMISVSTPMFNPNYVQLATGHYFATFIDNGTLVVNTFMTITGFLTFYKITRDLYGDKELNVFKNIINRFLRLTPAYMFVLALQYFMFPYIEGGPMSRTVVWDTNVFGSYWWTHLTYLNNYVKPVFQCLIPSWYIALDMQMYIFAYLLGGLLQKMKNLTPYLLSLSTIISLALPAITIAYTKYWATYRLFHTPVMEYFKDPEFQDMYLPTHIRSAPYVIGMLGGYVYYQVKMKKITFQTNTLWTWAFLSFGAIHVSLCWAYPFYIPGRDYVLWENVAYSWLHRLGWSAAIVWMIIATAIGNFRPYKYILGLRMYEPLNKLTYTALLVHGPIQVYMLGQIRSPVNYGRITGIWMACGDICFTYTFSIVLYLVVEGPFALLQKKFLDLPIFNGGAKSFKK